jgi:branched-chain amino acid transport system permease protein
MTVKFGFNIFIAMIVSSIATGFFGILIAYPAIRLRGFYLAVASIGLIEIVRVFFKNFEYTGGSAGFSGMFGTTIPLLYSIVGVCLALTWKLENSRIGLNFQAIKENDLVAESLGINSTYFKVVAFGLGAIMAGLGGALYAHYMFFIDPHAFGFHRALIILLFLVFGGLDSMFGAVVGALILTILPEVIPGLGEWRMIFYGLILIFVMNLRPQGVISRIFVKRVESLVKKN